MNIQNNLEQRLRDWKSSFEFEGPHLPDDVLYRLANAGGIKNADNETARHLSLCPTCLEKWADWRRAISAAEESTQESHEEFMSYGMLEAAASTGPLQPLNLQSRCGSFCLGVLPSMGNPDKGLLTLEAIGQIAASLEGRRVTIRDRRGTVLIDGHLHEGRVARPCEHLGEIDLSTWTIVFATEDC